MMPPSGRLAARWDASYGAELARVLHRDGLKIHEVNRPNRQARRLRGKSDPLDAYQAESVLAERGVSTPKARDGAVNRCESSVPNVVRPCAPKWP